MKLYAVKSSAHRAAKLEGLEKADYEVIEVDGKFGYRLTDGTPAKEAEAPAAEESVSCPHCGTHLDNGVGIHLQEVNGVVIKHKAFEYECLACGEEFGPAIAKESQKAAPKRKIAVTNRSTIIRPTKTVWHIASTMADANPDVTRKQVLEECARRGIAFYTARTQYQLWRAAMKDSSAN